MKMEESNKKSLFWFLYFLMIIASVAILWSGKNSFIGWILAAVFFIAIVIFRKVIIKLGCLGTIISWIVVILAIALTFVFTRSGGITGASVNKDTRKVLNNFYSSKTLHLKGISQTIRADGSKAEDEQFEVWKKGDMLRTDYIGTEKRTLIVKGGKATFFYYKDMHSESAVLDPAKYLDEYNKPSVNESVIGKDADNNGTIYQVEIDKIYDIKGAKNKWYQKDRIYSVGKDQIIYIKSHGNIPEGNEKPNKLDESIKLINTYETNKNIDDSIFNEPFSSGTKSSQDNTNSSSASADTDLGMYTGTKYPIGITHDKIKIATVTLNEILVGDKSFGKASDGTWLSSNIKELSEKKFVIASFTVKAKTNIDLKDLDFDITWEGNGGGLRDGNSLSTTGAGRFDFYRINSSLPMAAGETKKISVYLTITEQTLLGNKIFIQVMEPYRTNAEYDARGEFNITGYIK